MATPHVFVTTQEQRVDELRHEGVRRALWHLREGRPGAARAWLLYSVEQQARIAGIRGVELSKS